MALSPAELHGMPTQCWQPSDDSEGPETGSAGQSAAPYQHRGERGEPAFGPVPSVLGDLSLDSAERQS